VACTVSGSPLFDFPAGVSGTGKRVMVLAAEMFLELIQVKQAAAAVRLNDKRQEIKANRFQQIEPRL
jgi:hypothetical protein